MPSWLAQRSAKKRNPTPCTRPEIVYFLALFVLDLLMATDLARTEALTELRGFVGPLSEYIFLRSLLHDFLQQGGISRDDSVHALGNSAAHPARLVQVPDDDPQAGAMGADQESRRCEGPVGQHAAGTHPAGLSKGQQQTRAINSEVDAGVET